MSKNTLAYILHMTVVVLIGFPVMNWKMGIAFRYSFIVIGLILATIITYDLFVRRWRVARVLFGMKPRRGIVRRRMLIDNLR